MKTSESEGAVVPPNTPKKTGKVLHTQIYIYGVKYYIDGCIQKV